MVDFNSKKYKVLDPRVKICVYGSKYHFYSFDADMVFNCECDLCKNTFLSSFMFRFNSSDNKVFCYECIHKIIDKCIQKEKVQNEKV